MNKGLLSILQLLKTQGFKQRGVTIYGDGWVQLSLTRCPTNGLTECVSILVMSEPPEEEEEPEEEEAEQEELGSKEFAKGVMPISLKEKWVGAYSKSKERR